MTFISIIELRRQNYKNKLLIKLFFYKLMFALEPLAGIKGLCFYFDLYMREMFICYNILE